MFTQHFKPHLVGPEPIGVGEIVRSYQQAAGAA
jgi:hypothetical protein